MRSTSHFTLITYGLLILFIFQPSRVIACKCEGEIPIKEAVKYAEIVIKGIVISKTITSAFDEYGIVTNGATGGLKYLSMNPIAIYKIKVSSVFKGKQHFDTLMIATPVNGAGCGVRFTIGKEWIVYADAKDEVLLSNNVQRYSTKESIYFTNLCTRTAEWDGEEEKAIINCL